MDIAAAAQADTRPRPAGGRPRNSKLDTAILDAAAEVLRQHGMAGCTIEAVSRRSNVSRPTIYRRWPHRTALAIDVFARQLAREMPRTQTGDSRHDLADAAAGFAALHCGPGGTALAELLAAAVLEPGAAQLLQQRLFAACRDQLMTIWRAGVENGQLDPGLDADDAIDLLVGPAIFRLFAGRGPIAPQEARRLAQAAMHGLMSCSHPGS